MILNATDYLQNAECHYWTGCYGKRMSNRCDGYV